MIIIRGRNYYPQDIERTVEQCHVALRLSCSAAFSIEVEYEEQLVVLQEVRREYRHHEELDEVCRAIRQAIAEEHDIQVYAIALIRYGSILETSRILLAKSKSPSI